MNKNKDIPKEKIDYINNIRKFLNMKTICRMAGVNYNSYCSFIGGHYTMKEEDVDRLIRYVDKITGIINRSIPG